MHWPGRIAEPGAVRAQFAHAIDLMPTIMRAAGLEIPAEVDGVAQQSVDGVSLLSALEDPAAPELHHTQYFEMMGSRSIYHEGWKATTNHISTGILDEEELAVGSRSFDEDRWELFDLTADFSEAIDRADAEPERLARLRDLWDAEARLNNVLPISDGLVDRFGGFIPPAWPAGPSRTFRPGGGPSPTSRSRCSGAASTSRPTSTPPATGRTASSSRSATGSGATRCTWWAGGSTSRSPGPPTRSSWRRRRSSAPGTT